MPTQRNRSKSLRKIKTKVPGGAVKTHFVRRKPKAATCAVTGERLHGVARGRPYQVKKLSKTQRRPERPYGGILSSKAMRQVMIQKARNIGKKE